MTAPTPDVLKVALQGMRVADALGSGIEFGADELRALLDHLAAVTAERDERQVLHEETRVLLDRVLTGRDQARQMLADAPHHPDCDSMGYYRPGPCDCWKVEL